MQPKVLRMKDKSDDFVIKKDKLDDISFRMLICGRSGLGKTNLIASLLCLPENFGNDFSGSDIILFTPLQNDFKMQNLIKFKEVEEVYTEYNDEILNNVYDNLVDEFELSVMDKKKPKHKIIVLDDVSFGSALTGKKNALNRVFMNGRKHNISVIVSTQKYSQLATGIRANASSIFFYNSSMKEKELFELDANYIGNRKGFFKMLSDNLTSKRDFIYCNFTSENVKDMYMDTNFNIIDIEKYKLK